MLNHSFLYNPKLWVYYLIVRNIYENIIALSVLLLFVSCAFLHNLSKIFQFFIFNKTN